MEVYVLLTLMAFLCLACFVSQQSQINKLRADTESANQRLAHVADIQAAAIAWYMAQNDHPRREADENRARLALNRAVCELLNRVPEQSRVAPD